MKTNENAEMATENTENTTVTVVETSNQTPVTAVPLVPAPDVTVPTPEVVPTTPVVVPEPVVVPTGPKPARKVKTKPTKKVGKKSVKPVKKLAKKKAVKNDNGGGKNPVGAPAKPVSWPDSRFTFKALFARNGKKQCGLSLRKKLKDGLELGEIVQLQSRKQTGGSVGRPQDVYVMKENFDSKSMVRYGQNVNHKTVMETPVPVTEMSPGNVENIPANEVGELAVMAA